MQLIHSPKTKILYLRHGESQSNVAETFSGKKDESLLTAKGEEQARQAGLQLAQQNLKIDRIVASPMLRTQKTARLVAEAIRFDIESIETDARLFEYDMGDLTGKPRKDITSAQLIAAQGAEPPKAFMDRVISAFESLDGFEGTILIVAHAGVGRIIRCYVEGLDPSGFYDLPAYPNATVIASFCPPAPEPRADSWPAATGSGQ